MSPEPYYQDEQATIYCGDCREILPTLGRFDLLLTDPPYGIGADNRARILSRGKLATPKDYGESNWDSAPVDNWTLQTAIGCAGNQVVWGGNYFNVAPSSCWLVWDKKNGTNDFADCELAWTNFDRAVRKFEYRWNGMLQEHAGDKKEQRFHPQKPVPLMRWCLTFAPDAQSIFDPFMGSGTTLVAAKLEGRKAVGIEINQRYCDIAIQRLRQKVLF